MNLTLIHAARAHDRFGVLFVDIYRMAVAGNFQRSANSDTAAPEDRNPHVVNPTRFQFGSEAKDQQTSRTKSVRYAARLPLAYTCLLRTLQSTILRTSGNLAL